jgi:long-chain acyl-CoA synthetase
MTTADPYRAFYDSMPWRKHYDAHRLHGEQARPFPLYDSLLWAERHFPHRPFVSFRGHSLSYAEGVVMAERLAAALVALGVKKGDRVGYCMPNHPAFPLMCFAAWKIGAVAVSISPLFPHGHLQTLIVDSGVRAIITAHDPALFRRLEAVCDENGLETKLLLVDPDNGDIAAECSPPRPLPDRCLPLADLLRGAGSVPTAHVEPLTDLAAIAYTGGTTGKPKGVMLTHSCLSINIQQMCAWFPHVAPGTASIVAAAPFSHVGGYGPVTGVIVFLGGELIVQTRFDAADLLDQIAAGRISMLMLVPTMCVALCDLMETRPTDWSPVKTVLVGASPMSDDLRDRFERMTGTSIISIYGMTETSPATIYGMPHIPGGRGALGIPLPQTRVQVRDKDDPSRCVPPGEVGELCFAGPQVMVGYWNNPEETAKMFVDGFLRSGDAGFMTEDGIFSMSDRIKEIIIASGVNVYPMQVESVLASHPAIAEVAVVGVPDPYRGETVKAYVKLAPGATLTLAELQQAMADKLSPIEMPKMMEIIDALPLTENMKLARRTLKEMAAKTAAAAAA